ncbi:hypothetical protein M407DRAFT_130874 [Tulasnella calospora MUT 4182]|uniref:Uncharacterized protein n=1 Tax=Tulasnella calospora MUT 4182 TaxID=1051891 RepID=A0A0C3QAD9_9AGAM|nr:hypothetical protein M407DRAFT_130874 [Tulasnella calospora MUT 4182]
MDRHEALVVCFIPSQKPHLIGCLNATRITGNLSLCGAGSYDLYVAGGRAPTGHVSSTWNVLPDGSLQASLPGRSDQPSLFASFNKLTSPLRRGCQDFRGPCGRLGYVFDPVREARPQMRYTSQPFSLQGAHRVRTNLALRDVTVPHQRRISAYPTISIIRLLARNKRFLWLFDIPINC